MKGSRAFLTRLLAVALLMLLQGPAMLVQEAAWATMLVKYCAERGLSRGVVETFDGNHPCPLCRKARELRKQERQETPEKPAPPSRRFSLAWGEMLACRPLNLAPPAGRELDFTLPHWISRHVPRLGDPPPLPPPERT
jgi:hypothetical protein